MNSLIELKNLSVSYTTYLGTVQAVRNISLDIQPGKSLALVGESGCGKSVTAKALMGFITKPGKIGKDSIIHYQGTDITNYTEKEWNKLRGKDISMIFQDALVSLNPTIRVGDQIMESLINHKTISNKKEMRNKVIDILKRVGIQDVEGTMKKYPHQLSGGMRQRIMIASAMINNPKLLIADEPTTALDVTIQAQILKLIKELQNEFHTAILMITHDMGVVADIADEIAVMYAGEIIEKGPCEEIFYHPKHPYTWALLNSVPRVDKSNAETLYAIEGSIPNMLNPPKGCAFCARCAHALNICSVKNPEKTIIKKGHEVRCWLTHPKAKPVTF